MFCGSDPIITTYLSQAGYLRQVTLKQPIWGLQDHLGISKLEEQNKLLRINSHFQTHRRIWWSPIIRLMGQTINYKDSNMLCDSIDNISFSYSWLYPFQEYVGDIFL